VYISGHNKMGTNSAHIPLNICQDCWWLTNFVGFLAFWHVASLCFESSFRVWNVNVNFCIQINGCLSTYNIYYIYFDLLQLMCIVVQFRQHSGRFSLTTRYIRPPLSLTSYLSNLLFKLYFHINNTEN